jgi:hypothetical protein
MKRFFLAAMIIVAFSCVIAVTAGADAMTSANTTSATPSTDMNNSSQWVGRTTVDLLVNLGVPTYTDMLSSGETITYVKHEGVGVMSSVNVVRQFDVDSNGKITAERDSQS